MASIDTGSGGGARRKAVDSTLPLVPFIDLLLCCVMFLLVTAVWNQLAVLSVTQQVPGQTGDQAEVEKLRLFLQLDSAGYVFWSTAGDRLVIPKLAGEYDREALRQRVATYHDHNPNQRDITVLAEDGVTFEHIASAIDLLTGNGFSGLTLSES
jgi:biopolymer transport protein ExbD